MMMELLKKRSILNKNLQDNKVERYIIYLNIYQEILQEY